MPATYNGIGTSYVGKKNIEQRHGPCHSCGRDVTMKSYDTRLWFVFFFIPIIPLKRKRIIDYCPACSRHFAVDIEQWETSKQLEISGAMERFRSQPTPENAMAAHQQLLNFHEMEQALEFRKTMRTQFADNATVHAYLGTVLAHCGRADESRECFARAYALRPDMPEARVGVARQHIAKQEFDEARRLLDFLEKPGAEQLYPLEPLETLALACQKAGRHEQALELFQVLIRALPDITQHKGFRKTVAVSEKALGHKESILPKRKFRWRDLLDFSGQTRPANAPSFSRAGLIVIGVIALLVVLGLALGNVHVRRNRTLHLLSGQKNPIVVQIEGVGRFTAAPGLTEIKLPEGNYTAVIKAPVPRQVSFEMKAGYFSRWTDKPVWLLNVDNSALLLLETATYSQNPLPPTVSFFYGQPFFHFPRVTHPFQQLPETLRMKSGETRVLTRLDTLRGREGNAFAHLLNEGRMGDAMHLAEWRLSVAPDDVDVLRSYASTFTSSNQVPNVVRFLSKGLTNRPVNIEWHRQYQDARRRQLGWQPARSAELIAEYQTLLQQEPANSALMYLLGRVTPDRNAARALYERAVQADASSAYAHFALGYDRMLAGDWTAARPSIERALELSPRDAHFRDTLVTVRCGQKDFAALEKELEQWRRKDPLDYQLNDNLIHVLVAQGRTAEAKALVQRTEQRAAQSYGDNAIQLTVPLRCSLLYASADFAGLERVAQAQRRQGKFWLVPALVEQGKLAEAEKLCANDTTLAGDPFQWLALGIAAHLANDTDKAKAFSEHATALFRRGEPEGSPVLRLLAAAPDVLEAQRLSMQPRAKAILTAWLALQTKRPEMAEIARHHNVERVFPFHLIERAVNAARP